MTTHHPDARNCAEARHARIILVAMHEAIPFATTHGQLVEIGSNVARCASELSDDPTCPTCRAEMGCQEKDGAA